MKLVLAGTAGLLFGMLIVVTNSAAPVTTFTGKITDEKLNCVQTPMKAPDGTTNKYLCVNHSTILQV